MPKCLSIPTIHRIRSHSASLGGAWLQGPHRSPLLSPAAVLTITCLPNLNQPQPQLQLQQQARFTPVEDGGLLAQSVFEHLAALPFGAVCQLALQVRVRVGCCMRTPYAVPLMCGEGGQHNCAEAPALR